MSASKSCAISRKLLFNTISSVVCFWNAQISVCTLHIAGRWDWIGWGYHGEVDFASHLKVHWINHICLKDEIELDKAIERISVAKVFATQILQMVVAKAWNILGKIIFFIFLKILICLLIYVYCQLYQSFLTGLLFFSSSFPWSSLQIYFDFEASWHDFMIPKM